MNAKAKSWAAGILLLLPLMARSAWSNTQVMSWEVHSTYYGKATPSDQSQTRSLRGLAVSADSTSIYGGFIHGLNTGRGSIRKVSSSKIDAEITIGSPEIQGIVSSNYLLNKYQYKGVATDDRGYVYGTLSLQNGATTLGFQIYSSDLSTTLGTVISEWPVRSELGGLAVQKLNGRYYAYLGRNKGAGTIECWDVTDPAFPLFNGRILLADLTGFPTAYCNGLEVDTDGTIYCASGGFGAGTRGDSVLKINANGTAAVRVTLPHTREAMDVALFQNRVYVTQYLSSDSVVTVLNKSDLSFAGRLNTGIPHPYSGAVPGTDVDNGYSGIAISRLGRIYVADQIFAVVGPNRTMYDRVLSSQLADEVGPVIIAPASITRNTDPGKATAALNPGTATATDDLDGELTPLGTRSDGQPLLAPYPMGVTTITWTAADLAGNPAQAIQTVTVLDKEPPVLTVPADQVVDATGPNGAVASYPPATGRDNAPGPVTITHSILSGSTFPLGTTIVTVTATDASKNTSTGSFKVTVRDATGPVITANNVAAEATGPTGAVVTFSPTATDLVDGVTPVTSTPASGTTFPVGTTTVTVTAVDKSGNVSTKSFTVTVRDTTPPVITVPADISAVATSTGGAVVTFTVTAIDLVSGAVPVNCTPASGSAFKPGTTTVTCTATDRAGNTATKTFLVRVCYSWSGVLPPINPAGTSVFKLGSTIPVKFQLTGASSGVSNAPAYFSYQKVGSTVGAVNATGTTTTPTTGTLFRYTTGQYIYNWSTKGLTTGTYLITINLGDGCVRTVKVGLR
ncbi:MAG TPA: HYR domain-containing protein [Armatimonadota bacterium]|nr:HYR domain-containing protein [Armatimonadota bacterium]